MDKASLMHIRIHPGSKVSRFRNPDWRASFRCSITSELVVVGCVGLRLASGSVAPGSAVWLDRKTSCMVADAPAGRHVQLIQGGMKGGVVLVEVVFLTRIRSRGLVIKTRVHNT